MEVSIDKLNCGMDGGDHNEHDEDIQEEIPEIERRIESSFNEKDRILFLQIGYTLKYSFYRYRCLLTGLTQTLRPA